MGSEVDLSKYGATISDPVDLSKYGATVSDEVDLSKYGATTETTSVLDEYVVKPITDFATDVKSSAYRVSAGLWNEMANAAMLAQKVLPEAVSEFASLPQAEEFMRGQEASARSNIEDPTTFASKVNQGIATGVLSIPEYAIAGMKAPAVGFALLGALGKADEGLEAAAVGAGEGALFGGMLKAVSPLTRPAQAGILASVSGAEATLQGKSPEDVIASMTTAAGLGVLQGRSDGKTIKDAIEDFRRDSVGAELNRILDPLSFNTDKYVMVHGKKLMNRQRVIDHWKNAEFERLTKDFTPEERTKIYKAQADEHLKRRGLLDNETAGWNSLNAKERRSVERLQAAYEIVVSEAKKVGVLDGAYEVYDPRILVETLSPWEIARLGRGSSVAAGTNISTSFGQLKPRKYETLEQTQEAARVMSGLDVSVLQDVRVLPMVTAKLAKAVESKKFINHIKERGNQVDAEFVRSGSAPSDWFTNRDNPAFYENTPRIKRDEKGRVVMNEEGGVELVKTEDGAPVIDRTPIYIHPYFKGPLEAVTTKAHAKPVQILLDMKYKSMAAIMFNPIVHNSVIYFKAVPYDPVGMLTFSNYRRGGELLKDQAFVKEAMEHNTVFMDKYGAQRDIADLAPDPTLRPGRSWTSDIVGKIAKPFGAESQARAGVDRAGDVWHGTMLWKQVAKVQAALYEKTRNDLVKLGMESDAAGYAAGHIANRYGGAIPYEDMGRSLRTTLNFVLFSRSFTATNLGIYKDALLGLPESTKAQIEAASNRINTAIANGYIQKKQAEAMIADIAANIVIGAGLQTTITALRTDSTLDDIKDGYVRRMNKWVDEAHRNPLSVINPVKFFEDVSPQSENEPGKNKRVYVGRDKNGTAIYLKNPFGKIGEDLLDTYEQPYSLLRRKLSPLFGAAMDVASDDSGFKRDLWSPDDSTLKALGKGAWHVFKKQVPSDMAWSLFEVTTGRDTTDIQRYKALLGIPLGLSFSKGYPGGPELGQINDIERKRREGKAKYMPEIRKMIELGEINEAMDKMADLGFSYREAQAALRSTIAPDGKLTPRLIMRAMERASDEDREKLKVLLEDNAYQ